MGAKIIFQIFLSYNDIKTSVQHKSVPNPSNAVHMDLWNCIDCSERGLVAEYNNYNYYYLIITYFHATLISQTWNSNILRDLNLAILTSHCFPR